MRRAAFIALGVVTLLAASGYVLVRRALPVDLVREEIERRLSAYLGQPVHIGSASAAILPRVSIDLHDVTIGQAPVVQLSRVRLGTGVRALFSRRIEDAEVSMQDGHVTWPLPFSLPGSGAEGTAASASPAMRIVSVRRITFRNVTLVTPLPPIAIDLDAALDGDRLDVARLTARSDRNTLDATGTISSLARMVGQFRAKGFLTFDGYTARDFAATIAISPRGVALSRLAFSMFGGTFDGSLDLDLRAPVPRVQMKGSVAHVNVAEVLKDTASNGGITGRLDGFMAFTGVGRDGSALLRSAHGSFRATVVNGTLPYIDIVRPVVLAFGKPSGKTPGGSGSSFSTLGGSFALANGTLASENVMLDARDFTAHGRATLAVDSGAVDAHVNVILSEELTAQSGTDLRRYAQEDGRVVVPATIRGTLTHPSVFVDPREAMRRAFSNELKRRAGSALEGLFKKRKGGG